jgi:hypothetical protein
MALRTVRRPRFKLPRGPSLMPCRPRIGFSGYPFWEPSRRNCSRHRRFSCGGIGHIKNTTGPGTRCFAKDTLRAKMLRSSRGPIGVRTIDRSRRRSSLSELSRQAAGIGEKEQGRHPPVRYLAALASVLRNWLEPIPQSKLHDPRKGESLVHRIE